MGKQNLEYIAKHASENSTGVSIGFKEENDNYSHQRYYEIYKGYDLLENILVVRSYIQKHYDVDWRGVEILLKLMGMRVFTYKDYTCLPKPFTYTRFNNMRDRGFISLLQDHHSVEHQLFCLSARAQNLCINFYKMLAGEKPVPEDGRLNPMAKTKEQKAFYKKQMDLIKKMNSLPQKAHFKTLHS